MVPIESISVFYPNHMGLEGRNSLICEPKVEALVTIVGSIFEVIFAFLDSHGIPFLLSTRIEGSVENVGEGVFCYVHAADGNEISVAAFIQRLVIASVDIGLDDGSSLHAHVVYTRRHSSCPHAVRIARRPCDLDRVHIGIASNKRNDGEVNPLWRLMGECVQRNQQGEGPYLQDDSCARAAVDNFAEITYEEEIDHAQDNRWDTEKIGLCGIEPNGAQRQSEICLRRVNGNQVSETKSIDWPHSPVGDCLEDHTYRQTLAVVHA